MSTARKVVKLPTRPRKPAVKTSGYAVGLSRSHYDWITATAGALGISRQKLMDNIVGRLVNRASLGGAKARRAR